jgi:hypothetical protein
MTLLFLKNLIFLTYLVPGSIHLMLLKHKCQIPMHEASIRTGGVSLYRLNLY